MSHDPTMFPILVTGGSGKLARLIIRALLDRGVAPQSIITTTRTPAKLREFAELGIEVREADHDRPETLVDAFSGAQRMLLISGTPEAFLAGIRVQQHQTAVDAAIAAGVPHLFYTSAPNADPNTAADAHVDHWKTEQMLKQSGAEWTILRHWEWPDWHLEHHWRHAVDHGTYYAASGDGCISHVTRPDTAQADAGALLGAEVAGKTFDITGPERLTARDIHRALCSASGRNIALVELEPDELAEKLLETGTHPDTAPIFAMMANAIREGWYDGFSTDPEMLAGRKRKTVAEWLEIALPEVLARPPLGPWD